MHIQVGAANETAEMERKHRIELQGKNTSARYGAQSSFIGGWHETDKRRTKRAHVPNWRHYRTEM